MAKFAGPNPQFKNTESITDTNRLLTAILIVSAAPYRTLQRTEFASRDFAQFPSNWLLRSGADFRYVVRDFFLISFSLANRTVLGKWITPQLNIYL